MEELAEQQSSGVEREPPQTSEAETKLVKQWCEDIENAKRHWEDDFKRMRDDAMVEGFNLGRQNERDIREAAMIAGTTALALPEGIAQSVAAQMSTPPSWWERITSRRAKVVE